jgi:hypothetical protein
MGIITSDKKRIKISKKEWSDIGKKAGWIKKSSVDYAKLDSYIKAVIEEGKSFSEDGDPYPYAFGHIQSAIAAVFSDFESALSGKDYLISDVSEAIGAGDIIKKAIELSQMSQNK